MKKQRISDEQFKELLIKELAKPGSKANLKTNFFQLLQTKYSIDKTRALKLHDKYYSEYVNGKNDELAKVSIDKEKEALELALNDKNAHALDLIERINRLKEIRAGKALRIEDTLIIATFNDEMKAIAEIRAIRKQIGDWYGFNAAVKQDVTSKGESIAPIDNNKLEKLLSKLR